MSGAILLFGWFDGAGAVVGTSQANLAINHVQASKLFINEADQTGLVPGSENATGLYVNEGDH